MAVAFTGAGWIPIETNPEVIQKVQQASAVEQFGHHVPMGSNTKYTPRSGGVHLSRWGRSQPAPADNSPSDSVLLNSDKIGGKVTIAEEDMADSAANIVKTKSLDAGGSYGKLFDNICLGITVAKATSGWGFDSLYYQLTQNDTVTGYTANSNLTLAGSGGITYDLLNAALGKYEQGDYFDPAETIVIASPAFKQTLRGIKNSNGDPIFNESSNGTAGGGQGGTIEIFGHQGQWSMGCKTSTTGTDSPTGAPFIVFGNRQFLHVGDRNPLAVNFQDAESGIGVDTDENVLYFRARKAFAVGAPGAFSMLVAG
ncbi:phage major capsid protein [Amycolatopsis thailandensis]|uniref:phage major capsid family protein n=1 Tax=Amycolatopsis thailandensis TaxID=589330 RepID=UPI003658A281